MPLPGLSGSPTFRSAPRGTLFAAWYDARESASCTSGNPAVPCYRMWARKSTDNGVSWLSDHAFSDVVSPLPAQPDPGIQATYAGDYDYGSCLAKPAPALMGGWARCHRRQFPAGRFPRQAVHKCGIANGDTYADRDGYRNGNCGSERNSYSYSYPDSNYNDYINANCDHLATITRDCCLLAHKSACDETWVAAGFNSNNITTIGNPGQKIASQSLQAGSFGNCGTTTITVSH